MAMHPTAAIAFAFLAAAPAIAAEQQHFVPKPGTNAQSCIPIAQIRESIVRDDRTIDFRVGRRLYRNTLPDACPQLGSERRFSYATSLSQLCSVDIVTVLLTTGPGLTRGASCGLGQFQEVVPAAHH